jgi:hypothetical protein
MYITVDDRGDGRATLNPGQRQTSAIEALWYQAWRSSAKGWSIKKAEEIKSGGRRIGLRCLPLVHRPSRKKSWGLAFRPLNSSGLKAGPHALQASPTSAPYKPCFSIQ